VQFVKLAVAARDHPCCSWHLVACSAFDFNHI
jgi:hypothetical protein